MSEQFITSFVQIKNNNVHVNGQLYFTEDHAVDFASFIRGLYKRIDLNYPKFYKMDDLSKLALLGAELILGSCTATCLPEQKSVILNNRSASLDTDYKHQKAVEEGMVSPSVFVYTLPNICIGEIAIKNQLMGENTFYISEAFDIQTVHRTIDILHQDQKALFSIGGWVEFFQDTYELFLYSVEQYPQLELSSIKKLPIFASLILKDENVIHHPTNIELLYK